VLEEIKNLRVLDSPPGCFPGVHESREWHPAHQPPAPHWPSGASFRLQSKRGRRQAPSLLPETALQILPQKKTWLFPFRCC